MINFSLKDFLHSFQKVCSSFSFVFISCPHNPSKYPLKNHQSIKQPIKQSINQWINHFNQSFNQLQWPISISQWINHFNQSIILSIIQSTNQSISQSIICTHFYIKSSAIPFVAFSCHHKIFCFSILNSTATFKFPWNSTDETKSNIAENCIFFSQNNVCCFHFSLHNQIIQLQIWRWAYAVIKYW